MPKEISSPHDHINPNGASADIAVGYAALGCCVVGVGGAIGGAAVACGIYGGFVAAVWLAIIASAMSIAVGAGYTVLALSRIAAEAERKPLGGSRNFDRGLAAELERLKVAAAAKILASE